MKSDTVVLGPYRATKLWNDAILAFRNGMATGRHRRYMKSYDSCFVASEAIDWLHEQLQNNANFGPKVTRNQTLQLMQKFQKARVFEDVRGVKYNKDEFADNGRLYRFVETNDSPVKAVQSKTPVRVPLATQTTLMNSVHRPLRAPMIDKLKTTDDGESRTFVRSLKPQEIEEVWKSVTLNWLQKALQLTHVNEILDSDYVNAQNIIHNITHVNRNGVVTNIDREDQLPKWVLSAMRCLAHWPTKVEGDLPDYPGFEKDVYNTVTAYFQGLKEPLLTYSMYEVFTNAFVCAENMGRVRHPSRHNSAKTTPNHARIGLTSYASVENLMANLTMHAESILMPPPPQGPKANDEQKARTMHNGYISDSPGYTKEVHNADITLPLEELAQFKHPISARSISLTLGSAPPPSAPPPPPPPRSSSLFSAALIETSFGVDSNEPRTRIYANLPAVQPQSDTKLDPFFDPYAQSVAMTRQRQMSGGYLMEPKHDNYASTMSMYQTWREDNAVFDSESKCYSMSDVHNIAPCPENELGRNGERNPSWGSVHSVSNPKDTDTDSCQYGYAVVLSRTPKGDKTLNRVARPLPNADFISSDHCYSLSRHKALNNLDREIVSTSDLHNRGAPPPYRPPPKYERHQSSPVEDGYPKLVQSSRYARTSSTSVSSYESARSHLSPNSDSPASCGAQSPDTGNASTVYRNLSRDAPGTRSKVNLTESYQLAIDGSCTTPVGNRLFGGSLRRAFSSPNLLSPVARNRVQEALQICCLLLPPANRRKLHLLLRLMNKMANNEELKLDDQQTTRDFVLQTFSGSILRSADESDYEEELVLRLVTFLVDNYNDVMKVPESLKLQIDDRIVHLRRNKVKFCRETPANSSSSHSYCEQVSLEQYEIQKLSSSQRALQDLLENIIHDRKMASRDKKKRLKQFQKNHPDVYSKRFPTSESEADLFPNKPKIKQPLLSKPLQKLKSFRI